MSRLFQHRNHGPRSEFDELKKVLGRLNAASLQTRLAVGAGVHLANAEFIRRFGGFESFRRTPSEQQQQFGAVLSELELGSRSQEPGVAVGIGLYRIWLADMLADRRDTAELLGEELTRLSRRAGGGCPARDDPWMPDS